MHPQVAPPVFNRPHSITAVVEIPAGGAEGVLLAQGGVAGGYVLYVKDEICAVGKGRSIIKGLQIHSNQHKKNILHHKKD